MSSKPELPTMEYRPLGQTDLSVSLIGFGASPLGNAFRWTDPAEGVEAVHLAIDRGINFFDVSPYYGLTLAETRLGEALVGHRDKVILATKCGRYGAGEFDFSAARVIASVDESLTRLQTDYIDLFQAHDVEFGHVQQIIHETVPAMRKLQEQGKVRHIGITGYPPALLTRIAGAATVDTILSYCHYNLMISDMDDLLTPFAQRENIGLINASGLHMGLLTNDGPPEWHPASPEILEAGKRATEFCRERGLDISAVALRYCLDHAFVSSTLVGMATREHVEANLSLLSLSSDPALLAELRAILAPVYNQTWTSGLPENR